MANVDLQGVLRACQRFCDELAAFGIHCDPSSLTQLTSNDKADADGSQRSQMIKLPIQIAKRQPIYGNAADKAWGYIFGVDGLMDPEEAGEFLAVSGRQLDRFATSGWIRKGLMPSGVRRFCRKSIVDFARTREK